MNKANNNKIVTFGEIMMRLSTPDLKRFTQSTQFDVEYGGSEANIAYTLANWQQASQFVTALPNNTFQTVVQQQLGKVGVELCSVEKQQSRLGLYFLEQGVGQRKANVIYDRANSAFAQLTRQDINWFSIFEDASWFHISGITPALNKELQQVLIDALHIAKQCDIKVSIDLNYRASLWSDDNKPLDIIPKLLSYCDVLLADPISCHHMLGISLKDFDFNQIVTPEQLTKLFQQVIKQFPNVKEVASLIREVISSSHHNLQGFVYDGEQHSVSRAHQANPIVDRVGSGDAFMAGLIYQLHNAKPLNQTIQFATAAAALKHTIAGDKLPASSEEIIALANQDTLRINR